MRGEHRTLGSNRAGFMPNWARPAGAPERYTWSFPPRASSISSGATDDVERCDTIEDLKLPILLRDQPSGTGRGVGVCVLSGYCSCDVTDGVPEQDSKRRIHFSRTVCHDSLHGRLGHVRNGYRLKSREPCSISKDYTQKEGDCG